MAERDPLIGAHFALDVDGVVSAYFKEATGFNNSSEVITHQAVDDKGRSVIQKLPGDLTWDDIVLRRGISDDKSLWDWRQKVIEGNVGEARANGSVIMYNTSNEEVARFDFINGWPSGWKGPDVNAEDQTIAIEEITIAHEGLVRKN
ncbi:MAG: phage tail protein [Chloroflexi bacterium]|nr:phage tail protein [Chloroflexota bacterium]MCI0794383.1 phage tail protein [Chloroflexota bacterium]MCI0799720.1 phage tail protein [Chloroflexota bacterium]MCI0866446.1 phage tail protein [Chloroflexota bacterium]MCI0880333.1 phage tail protein [Chloroflexota bacterium]